MPRKKAAAVVRLVYFSSFHFSIAFHFILELLLLPPPIVAAPGAAVVAVAE